MKKYFLILSLLFLTLNINAQKIKHLKPSFNKSGYTIRKKYKKNEGAIIYGYVMDFNKNPLYAFVFNGCDKFLTDKNGFYRIELKKKIIDYPFYLVSGFVGYSFVETERFKISKNDSIKINFYLAEDDRPLINCVDIPLIKKQEN